MNYKKADRVSRPLGRLIRDYFQILPWKDPVDWAREAIDFSGDLSAQRTRLDFQMSPFLMDPIRAWDFRNRIREVTVVGVQQMGKSLTWIVGLLYSLLYNPRRQSLVVYPSDDLAQETNATKLKPLMEKIPQLARQLWLPHVCRSDRYAFSNNISYFQGSGRKLMSKSCAIRIADEVDQWSSQYPGNFADLRKRGRSYSQSILYAVCSPTVEQGRIWREFLDGSRGYWTLRCLNCGRLTMRSCDLHHLQFESRQDEATGEWRCDPESIRLICPECRHQHVEADKRKMNLGGAYVHQIPDRVDLHPSFQFGALASQMPYMSWQRIADQILRSGRRSDETQQKILDNSFRGLPWKRRKILAESAQTVAKKAWLPADAPKEEDVQAVFLTADTMDTFIRWAAWAWDKDENLFLLQAGQCRNFAVQDSPNGEETLQDVMQRPAIGQLCPLFGMVDAGGHRARQVDAFVNRRRDFLQYRGNALRAQSWYLSKNVHKLLIANAKEWQATALSMLTAPRRERSEGGQLYINPKLEEKYVQQLAAMRPDNAHKSGNLPENWTDGGAPSHTFDTFKEAVLAIDVMVKTFPPSRFRLNQARSLRSRRQGPPPGQIKVKERGDFWGRE